MALPVQDALIYLMVVTASSDLSISNQELERIEFLIERSPVFAGFERDGLAAIANRCVDMLNGATGLEGVVAQAVAAVPERLHDTAYALAVEVAVVDLTLPQEELRLLELVRDQLRVDRLVTAAIETAARARLRRLD